MTPVFVVDWGALPSSMVMCQQDRLVAWLYTNCTCRNAAAGNAASCSGTVTQIGSCPLANAKRMRPSATVIPVFFQVVV